MPMEVIACVNRIGQAQGHTSLITFQDRHGHSIGDTNPDFAGVLPQLAGVVHDNDDDDIGPDDDNIGTDPPYPTPIEQEDTRELEDEQPLTVNNEPTDVNPITSTSDTTTDNTSDRSVQR